MSEIQTQVTINASIKQVWEVLSNYAQYKEWSTFLKEIHGELKEGNVLRVLICPPDGKPMMFSPILINVKKEQEIRWIGKFLCRHVFQGEHYFQLTKLEETKTQLTHGEIFSGVLSPIFNLSFANNTKKGFELFNKQIKQRAENFPSEGSHY